MSKQNICIVGSGNWGSAIARVIGQNCTPDNKLFNSVVKMWVFEEEVNGRKLTEIINTDHVNVKYLPDISLPKNVLAVPDLVEAAQQADILVFVLPHQFIARTCAELKGKIKKTAVGVSLIKGFEFKEGGISLISHVINEILGIDVAVLMGANLAQEVACEKFAEATLGMNDIERARSIRPVFQRPYFRISCVNEPISVELCGALKNIVAVGAGFIDGLDYGNNTKAAIIRLGLMEMMEFCGVFYQCYDKTVFFESCGVADLVTTCYGGRHRRLAEMFVRTGKSFEVLEKEVLNGQILQGPQTSKKVYQMLKAKGKLQQFPLFVAVYKVCYEGLGALGLLKEVQEHDPHPHL